MSARRVGRKRNREEPGNESNHKIQVIINPGQGQAAAPREQGAAARHRGSGTDFPVSLQSLARAHRGTAPTCRLGTRPPGEQNARAGPTAALAGNPTKQPGRKRGGEAHPTRDSEAGRGDDPRGAETGSQPGAGHSFTSWLPGAATAVLQVPAALLHGRGEGLEGKLRHGEARTRGGGGAARACAPEPSCSLPPRRLRSKARNCARLSGVRVLRFDHKTSLPLPGHLPPPTASSFPGITKFSPNKKGPRSARLAPGLRLPPKNKGGAVHGVTPQQLPATFLSPRHAGWGPAGRSAAGFPAAGQTDGSGSFTSATGENWG